MNDMDAEERVDYDVDDGEFIAAIEICARGIAEKIHAILTAIQYPAPPPSPPEE